MYMYIHILKLEWPEFESKIDLGYSVACILMYVHVYIHIKDGMV
jgi:hypothetical protein